MTETRNRSRRVPSASGGTVKVRAVTIEQDTVRNRHGDTVAQRRSTRCREAASRGLLRRLPASSASALWLCASVASASRCLCGVLRGLAWLAPLALGNRRLGVARQVDQHADRQRREDDRDELRGREDADRAAVVAAEDLDDEARDRVEQHVEP